MATGNSTRLMRASEKHLALCLRQLRSTADPAELEEGEGLTLVLALRYGSDTIRAVRLLLKHRLRVQAFAAARGFVELSIRLVWAARAADGWNRFRGYFAGEDIKTAERCVKEFGWPRSTYPILSDSDALALAAVRPRMPDIAELLRQVYEADATDGVKHEPGAASQAYIGQFCFLHPAAHGSPTAIDSQGIPGYEWHLDVFLAGAAFNTMRGVYLHQNWQPDELLTGILEELERRCRAEGMVPPAQRSE